MKIYEIYKDIIGPILCSVIGGMSTVIGVYLTIRYEKNKEKKELKERIKPLFYRLDSRQDYDYKSAIEYVLGTPKKYRFKMQGIFKNTEKALMIIDYLLVNDKKYYPINGDVVDKNMIFYLDAFFEEDLDTINELILFIKDIYDNKYKYKLELEIINDGKSSMVKKFIELI